VAETGRLGFPELTISRHGGGHRFHIWTRLGGRCSTFRGGFHINPLAAPWKTVWRLLGMYRE
jgi:hypothetical protein